MNAEYKTINYGFKKRIQIIILLIMIIIHYYGLMKFLQNPLNKKLLIKL